MKMMLQCSIYDKCHIPHVTICGQITSELINTDICCKICVSIRPEETAKLEEGVWV